MAQDFEQLLKDVFGEPLSRLSQFQSEQLNRLSAKLQEIAREAVHDDFQRMQTELNELRARLTRLEAERVEAAADQV